MNTVNIFRSNQLLFLEAGILLASAVTLGIFLPLLGLLYPLIAVTIFLIYCFLASIIDNGCAELEDISDVFRLKSFPSSTRILISCLFIFVVGVLISFAYFIELQSFPEGSTVCTFASTFLGLMGFSTCRKNSKLFIPVLFFTMIMLPLTAISLFVGAVVSLPLAFIYFYQRA